MLKKILTLDAQLSEKMRVAEKPGALRSFAVFFAHSGDSWFWALALIILWAASSTWKHWAVVQLFWISILAALVLILKFSIRRQRPQGEWGAIYRNTDPHSFPSGHAARAFLIAVLASLLGPFWLALVLWIWAPLVALARVAMGVHYLSDIVAGSFFGILVAFVGWQISPAFFASLTQWINFPLW